MGVRIKIGDTVKIISGANKGTTGKVTKVMPSENKVFIEGVGNRTRHMRPTQYRQGGKKDIQVGIDASNVALVIDTKAGTTSRVGYGKDKDGKTVRIARQANNREIK
ncbi:50S ribosomal protein L24 [Candidatus Saccharibacteria bacterium]|jgi:large subunit ribosomal protein L24|nr:50S ribosomal protein L24 [Candidatus Saccharibacteria bacterium]